MHPVCFETAFWLAVGGYLTANLLFSALIAELVFVLFNHFLDHLSADRACLTRGEIAVIAVCEVYADLVCRLHLELLHCCLCLGYYLIGRCHLIFSFIAVLAMPLLRRATIYTFLFF